MMDDGCSESRSVSHMGPTKGRWSNLVERVFSVVTSHIPHPGALQNFQGRQKVQRTREAVKAMRLGLFSADATLLSCEEATQQLRCLFYHSHVRAGIEERIYYSVITLEIMAHDAPAMSGDPNSNSPSGSSHTTANAIPNPPFMRHRISGRAAAFDEGLGTLSPSQMRSNSMFSISSFDETRRSLRTSTDDLLLPRVSRPEDDLHEEPSQWQSLPLALAIIPAFGGLLFSNGRATVTDILLLGLSAIFLNWSLRLPW